MIELLPTTRDKPYHQLALEQSTYHQHTEVVHYLLQSGVRSQAAFVRACAVASPSILEAYVEHSRIKDGCIVGVCVGPKNKQKKQWATQWRRDVWVTRVQMACLKGNETTVRFLLERNATVREEDIAAACESEGAELVELLQKKVRNLPR